MNYSDILLEVTQKLDNKTLEVLSHTPLWNSIKSFTEDQLWWFHRVEYLVGQSLTPRRGNWRRVYTSLSENGLGFDTPQDYDSPLLVSILFEIGADPTRFSARIMRYASNYQNTQVFRYLLEDIRIDPSLGNNLALLVACDRGSTDIVRLLLEDPRVDPAVHFNRCLVNSIEWEYTDIVRLLLGDKRVDPSSTDNTVLLAAVGQGDAEIVQLILSDKRVDPSLSEGSDHASEAIVIACRIGSTEIVRLLLSDPRVDPTGDESALAETVYGNHIEVVRLLLIEYAQRGITWHNPVLDIIKKGSFEMIRLLLSKEPGDLTVGNNYALRMTRKYGRRDVEELLLEDPEVKEKDKASRLR